MRPRLAIAGLAFIALGGVVWFGWWSPATSEATEQVREQVRTVQLDNGSGDVAIRVADTGTTTVRQHFEYRWGDPEQAYSVEGDELVLGDCGWNCSVDYEVTVPRGTVVTGTVSSGTLSVAGVASADVGANSGDVRISDVRGPVSVEADSGSVQLSRVSGRTSVQASSGDVEGAELTGPVSVDASSGDVQLRLARPQDVRAEASSGSIEVLVPDAGYRVTADASSGERSIDVREDPAAAHTLDLHASSGDISAATR